MISGAAPDARFPAPAARHIYRKPRLQRIPSPRGAAWFRLNRTRRDGMESCRSYGAWSLSVFASINMALLRSSGRTGRWEKIVSSSPRPSPPFGMEERGTRFAKWQTPARSPTVILLSARSLLSGQIAEIFVNFRLLGVGHDGGALSGAIFPKNMLQPKFSLLYSASRSTSNGRRQRFA